MREPPKLVGGKVAQGSSEDVTVIDPTSGIALGGQPGGGDGYGGGSNWASGGGVQMFLLNISDL